MCRYLYVVLFLVAGGPAASSLAEENLAEDESGGAWKAGVASVVITPQEPLRMAGYAARTKPAEGKVHDLHAKALALEDAGGTRLVIVTLDLIGVPRAVRDQVQKQVGEKYRLPPSGLLINASHTHCGPVVRTGPSIMFDLSAEESRRIAQYVAWLQDRLVGLVGQALADLKPAQLGYGHARAGFAMNRRLPTEKGFQNSPHPAGPVDHAVPVLRVTAAGAGAGGDGKLRALLFGYACHNTTLSFQQLCGDYAGFAQRYLEEAHPGATTLFLAGCGGDQNPYPRGTLEHAQQHGRALANAVEAALLPKAAPVAGPLRSVLEEVTLDFAPPAGREALLKLRESKDPLDRRKAEYLLAELDRHGRIAATYAYPVHVVRFGGDLTLVALAGETVVDYSLRLKRELPGTPLWVAGYSNDVFGYVPSVRVLAEGGYEAGGAFRFSTLPGPLAASVEERIVGKVHELVRKASGDEHKKPGFSKKPGFLGTPPRVVGHRGLLRQAPENTLAGFQGCLALRAGFELDVRRTKDGQLVCLHDDDVQRTTDGRGRVADLTLAELEKLDAGGWFDPSFAGQRVPRLADVFALLAKEKDNRGVLVALDLKIDDEKVEADVLRLATEHGVLGQVLCIGRAISEPDVRKRLRAADAKAPVAALAGKPGELLAAVADRDSDWVYLRFVPTPEQVAAIHAVGKRVFLSGPLVAGHEPENWRAAWRAGVDALLTDYPLECHAYWRALRVP
jgi:glycerophosphoryl diester phosphodiesterase